MKVTFWLLDINAELKGSVSELWLWGIDQKGNRLLIIDRTFTNYFYAVIEEGRDPAKVAEGIRRSIGNLALDLQIVERRYFGKPVQAIKVFCSNHDEVAKIVRSVEGVKMCLEDDIRVSMRYLIDNNVVPCSWHEVAAKETVNTLEVHVANVYVAETAPKLVDIADAPDLRILSFSTTCYSREGSPKPDRNPVIIVSTVTSKGKEKQFLADEKKDDKKLLQDFMKYVQEYNPDIITGYGTNRVDMAYLRERCKILGIKLSLDRAGTQPHTSVYGHVSLTGVANLDLADFADQFPEVKVKTLENLADHVGVMSLDQRRIIWDVDFADYWDNPNKFDELKRFAQQNACRVKGVANALIDFAIQLSSLVSLPLDHVMTAAVGFRVDWFLIKNAQRIGELVPKRVEQPYMPYIGGLVLQPQPGLHENIAVLDFKSMYPNLMLIYNLSPDTYIEPKEKAPPGGVYEAPEVHHRFRREPPGFFKEIVSYLVGVRNEIRTEMKNLNNGSVEYRLLDARQKAVKIITNATYGYAGWIGARWYSKPVAEAAAAWGRHTIQTAINMAKGAGLKVIYGDTDSIFVTYDEKKALFLAEEIKKELGLEIELGNLYVRVFFTEAKKRYAGLLKDGALDIVGLEVVRGDWAEVAKNVQERVLEIILKEQSPQKAETYVHNVVDGLKQRKIGYRDLIIWKTLTKPVEEYAVRAGHVEAAKMLQAEGWRMTVGDKVGYVVLKGEGKLYSRVKPYAFASLDDVDVDYYVENQVVPAAVRVLGLFGITAEKLLLAETNRKRDKSLVEFMGA